MRRQGRPHKAYNNKIYNNGKTGIQYETCKGGSVIRGNTITRNGYVKPGYRTSRAGMLLQDPRNVDVPYNRVGGHPGHGIYALKGNRQRIAKVRIHHNRLSGDTMRARQSGKASRYAATLPGTVPGMAYPRVTRPPVVRHRPLFEPRWLG